MCSMISLEKQVSDDGDRDVRWRFADPSSKDSCRGRFNSTILEAKIKDFRCAETENEVRLMYGVRQRVATPRKKKG